MFFVLQLVSELLKRHHTGDIFKVVMAKQRFAKRERYNINGNNYTPRISYLIVCLSEVYM